MNNFFLKHSHSRLGKTLHSGKLGELQYHRKAGKFYNPEKAEKM